MDLEGRRHGSRRPDTAVPRTKNGPSLHAAPLSLRQPSGADLTLCAGCVGSTRAACGLAGSGSVRPIQTARHTARGSHGNGRRRNIRISRDCDTATNAGTAWRLPHHRRTARLPVPALTTGRCEYCRQGQANHHLTHQHEHLLRTGSRRAGRWAKRGATWFHGKAGRQSFQRDSSS